MSELHPVIRRERRKRQRKLNEFVPHRLVRLEGHLRYLTFEKASKFGSFWRDSDNAQWHYDGMTGQWAKTS